MPGFDIFSFAAGYKAGGGGGGEGGNLPPGGSRGQVLVKQSGANYDAAWETPGYTHDQMTAAAVWVVQHNLGRYPAVTVVDSSGREVLGEVQYTTLNSVTITFSAAFSGKAFFS